MYHDVSEDTHWTPFTNVTLKYIRDNFKQPWSQVRLFILIQLLDTYQYIVNYIMIVSKLLILYRKLRR